jgi:hypothetical protein
MRIGVGSWQTDDHIARLLREGSERLGHTAIALDAHGKLPDGLDVLLIHGPQGSPLNLALQLEALPAAGRPKLAFWHTEQFWNPTLPSGPAKLVCDLRSGLERFAYRRQGPAIWQPRNPWRRLTQRALRLRYFGDLRWLQRTGLLTVVAATSRWMASFLNARGVRASLAYFGADPSWGEDLGLERDIDVLWLGKIATDRRGALLRQIRAELDRRGVKLVVVDGVEHPYVFGKERTILLNRTKVVLNVLRMPWDNHSIRFYLAAPNCALVVSEPTLPHLPYEDGVHVVYAPLPRLPDVIAHYCRNEGERRQIVDEMRRYTLAELTLEKGLVQVLAGATTG